MSIKLHNFQRYAEFLDQYQGTYLNLGKAIMEFKASDGRGIGSGVKPWVLAGMAKKTGPKTYFLDPDNYETVVQNAEAVLEARYKLYNKNKSSHIEPLTEAKAIQLLKSKGYKILKPNTQYTEI